MYKKIEVFTAPVSWNYVFQPMAVIRVTGEDALSFLQGQFTQELRSTAELPVAYGLWLNQKGKVLADSFVLKEAADNLLIVSFEGSATVICERLEAYVIADDVTLEDVSDAWKGVVLSASEAAGVVERASVGGGGNGAEKALPAVGQFAKVCGGFLFRGRRAGAETDVGAETWEWILPVDAGAVDISATGALAGTALSFAQIEELRIAAGIPAVPRDIGPTDLPNEGGLDVNAISYTKGCYLGQEVMARLKAMGTLRRRLVRVRGVVGVSSVDATAGVARRVLPAVPCALLQGEKRVGELRSVVRVLGANGSDSGFIGLAMISKLGLDPAGLLAPEPGGEGWIEIIDAP